MPGQDFYSRKISEGWGVQEFVNLCRVKDREITNQAQDLDRFKVQCSWCHHKFLPEEFKYAEKDVHCSDICEETDKAVDAADRLRDEHLHEGR